MTIKAKILKVKTAGSVEEGNRRPIIADLWGNPDTQPDGADIAVLEYNGEEGTAILRLTWIEELHPLMKNVKKAIPEQITQLLAHPSIIEELPSHPKAKKRIFAITDEGGDIEELPGKKIKLKKTKEQGSFIRKERDRHDATRFIYDEG